MTHFRVYPLDDEGRIVRGIDLDRDSDGAATAFAIGVLQPGAKAEIWEGTRYVGLVAGPAPATAGPQQRGRPTRAQRLVRFATLLVSGSVPFGQVARPE